VRFVENKFYIGRALTFVNTDELIESDEKLIKNFNYASKIFKLSDFKSIYGR